MKKAMRCGNCKHYSRAKNGVAVCAKAGAMRADINNHLPPCLIPGVREIFICADDKPTHCMEYRERSEAAK